MRYSKLIAGCLATAMMSSQAMAQEPVNCQISTNAPGATLDIKCPKAINVRYWTNENRNQIGVILRKGNRTVYSYSHLTGSNSPQRPRSANIVSFADPAGQCKLIIDSSVGGKPVHMKGCTISTEGNTKTYSIGWRGNQSHRVTIKLTQ